MRKGKKLLGVILMAVLMFSGTASMVFAETIDVQFFVLKEGLAKPDESPVGRYNKNNYEYLGTGKVEVISEIYNGKVGTGTEDASKYTVISCDFANPEKYSWYVLKHESDGWHIDGMRVSEPDIEGENEVNTYVVSFVNSYTRISYVTVIEEGNSAIVYDIKEVEGYVNGRWIAASSEYSLSDCGNVQRDMTFYAEYDAVTEQEITPSETVDFEDEETPLAAPVVDFEDEATPLDSMPKTGKASFMLPAAIIAAVSLGVAFIIRKKERAEN